MFKHKTETHISLKKRGVIFASCAVQRNRSKKYAFIGYVRKRKRNENGGKTQRKEFKKWRTKYRKKNQRTNKVQGRCQEGETEGRDQNEQRERALIKGRV